MHVRLNYGRVAPGVYDAMEALDTYLATRGLEAPLVHLVRQAVALNKFGKSKRSK